MKIRLFVIGQDFNYAKQFLIFVKCLIFCVYIPALFNGVNVFLFFSRDLENK